MKEYQKPLLTVLELTADESLAAAKYSEPTVEDTDKDLSV